MQVCAPFFFIIIKKFFYIYIKKRKDGEEITIYLKEKGVSFRTEQVSSQLYPKSRYPLLNLKNRQLYNLIPGKIYAINIDTL